MSGYNDGQLRELVVELRKSEPALMSKVEQAFANCTFIYGTQGKGGGGLKLGGIMADAINKGEHQLKGADGSKSLAFTPGSRGYAFQSGVRQTVQRAHNYQMMDMYYGDGQDVGKRANEFILRFVMYAAKLRPWPGTNTPSPQFEEVTNGTVTAEHPFYAYRQIMGDHPGYLTHPKTTKAYGNDEWNQYEITGTKELSRIIRWGIGEFGGTIVFEGVDVYYDQVFRNTGRFGDTELEACSFFHYFTPGKSTANYGRGAGKVVFQWHGVETVPSKLLFLTSWQFNELAAKQWYAKVHAGNFQKEVGSNIAGARQGGGTPNQFRKVAIEPQDIDEIATKLGLRHTGLWNKFNALPSGVPPWGVGQWLNSLMQ